MNLVDFASYFNTFIGIMMDVFCSPLLAPYSSVLNFMPNELGDVGSELMLSTKAAFRVGLLIPMCGSAGLWAPSCMSNAQVAIAQLNEMNGICGRPVDFVMIDAALEAPTPIGEVVNSLIETGVIDAIVGMHISAVRQVLGRVVKQRIPYIYTPLYEGGENTNGLFAIGDTPRQQLGPALDYFCTNHRIRRWALVGNDYVWPRSSNSYAKRKLKEFSATVVYERYVPFGLNDMSAIVRELEQTDAEAILISLVGQDAVVFNRIFGAMGMHKKMLRLSCAIEENGLLASGEENLRNLYATSSYFGALDTDANRDFKERYHNMHGETAPVLNALGQSVYEGIQFLAELMQVHKYDWKEKNTTCVDSVNFVSIRRPPCSGEGVTQAPVYLSRAEGLTFEIIKKL